MTNLLHHAPPLKPSPGILFDTASSKYVYTSHFEDVDGTERMLVAVEMDFDNDAWPELSGEPWLPQVVQQRATAPL